MRSTRHRTSIQSRLSARSRSAGRSRFAGRPSASRRPRGSRQPEPSSRSTGAATSSSPPPIRHGRTTGLLAGSLATLVLSATPVTEQLGDAVTEVVGTTASGGAGGDQTATADAVQDGAVSDTHTSDTHAADTGAGDGPSSSTSLAGPPTSTAVVTPMPERPASAPAGVGVDRLDIPGRFAPRTGADSLQQTAAQDDDTDVAAAAPRQDDDGTEPHVWDDLADCESGDWDRDGDPIEGTARWDYGLEFAHEGFEQFQGGLNFHPATWGEFRDPDMPDHAGHAEREEELIVGQRVLEAQGWEAWPVCSQMLGLR